MQYLNWLRDNAKRLHVMMGSEPVGSREVCDGNRAESSCRGFGYFFHHRCVTQNTVDYDSPQEEWFSILIMFKF